jgi:hypothetical protein
MTTCRCPGVCPVHGAITGDSVEREVAAYEAPTVRQIFLCETQTCAALFEEATATVYWPGQTVKMCGPCAQRAGNISEAMGFKVAIEPIAAQESRT